MCAAEKISKLQSDGSQVSIPVDDSPFFVDSLLIRHIIKFNIFFLYTQQKKTVFLLSYTREVKASLISSRIFFFLNFFFLPNLRSVHTQRPKKYEKKNFFFEIIFEKYEKKISATRFQQFYFSSV